MLILKRLGWRTVQNFKFHKACLNKLSWLIQKGKWLFEEPTHASPAKTRRCSAVKSTFVSFVALVMGIWWVFLLVSVTSVWEHGLLTWRTLICLVNLQVVISLHKMQFITRNAWQSTTLATRPACAISIMRARSVSLSWKVLPLLKQLHMSLRMIVMALTTYDLYTARLNELGGMVPDRIHTTRCQECILSQIPWMSGQKAALHRDL